MEETIKTILNLLINMQIDMQDPQDFPDGHMKVNYVNEDGDIFVVMSDYSIWKIEAKKVAG